MLVPSPQPLPPRAEPFKFAPEPFKVAMIGSWSFGRRDLAARTPTDYVIQGPLRLPFRRRRSPDPDLARGDWVEDAPENVLHVGFFDVLRLQAGSLHRRFAELDCRDIGESAAKPAERRPNAAGEVDFLEPGPMSGDGYVV